jgi:hypothetical protein
MPNQIISTLDRFKNPALWITILGIFFYLSIRVNNIDVIEKRLGKKIEIQNEILEIQNMHEIEFLKKIHVLELKSKNTEIELLKKIHVLELKTK